MKLRSIVDIQPERRLRRKLSDKIRLKAVVEVCELAAGNRSLLPQGKCLTRVSPNAPNNTSAARLPEPIMLLGAAEGAGNGPHA